MSYLNAFRAMDPVQYVRKFNETMTYVVSDYLVHREFSGNHEPLDTAIPIRVVALDSLYVTRLQTNPHAPGEHSNRIQQGWQEITAAFEGLGGVPLSAGNEDVVAHAAEGVFAIIRGAPANNNGGHRSFASKFCHWCTRQHFPMVDTKARNAIRELQQKPGVIGIGAADLLLDKDTYGQQGWIDDYRRWIRFYGTLMDELKTDGADLAAELHKADNTGLNSPGQPFHVHNSLLRILDKVFYVRGGAL